MANTAALIQLYDIPLFVDMTLELEMNLVDLCIDCDSLDLCFKDFWKCQYVLHINIYLVYCIVQWRSKGGGDGGGLPRAAVLGGVAKLRLYLKIWKGKQYFEGEKF